MIVYALEIVSVKHCHSVYITHGLSLFFVITAVVSACQRIVIQLSVIVYDIVHKIGFTVSAEQNTVIILVYHLKHIRLSADFNIF